MDRQTCRLYLRGIKTQPPKKGGQYEICTEYVKQNYRSINHNRFRKLSRKILSVICIFSKQTEYVQNHMSYHIRPQPWGSADRTWSPSRHRCHNRWKSEKGGVAPYHKMSYQNGHNRSDQNRRTWHIILHRPMYAYTCPLTSGRGEQCRRLRLTTYPGPGSVWETLRHPRME